jgi:ferredoxin
LRAARSLACKGEKPVEGGLVTFQDRFHGSVPIVPDPSAHRVLLGEPPHRVAKEDALDASMDDDPFPHRGSRLRALPYRIDIDLLTCVGFAECMKTAPGVFRLDEFMNQSTVVDANGADEDTVLQAAQACPVSAISLYDAATGAKVFGEG